ncbi:MAG: OmpH family outer membrane protein [Rikenellaceae bacterium]
MKIAFIVCAALVIVACNTTQTTAPVVATTPATESEAPATNAATSDIAYVDIDMALSQCDIFNTEGIALQKKTEKAQVSWSQKEQKLQSDAAALQDKYQRGLITTSNAQLEQEKLQKRAAEYQSAAQTELQKLDEENTVFTNRTRDLVRRAVEEINADRRYKLIINAASLIDADTTLNITSRVVEVVNRLYAEDNKR